jgi:hypothetical protein
LQILAIIEYISLANDSSAGWNDHQLAAGPGITEMGRLMNVAAIAAI